MSVVIGNVKLKSEAVLTLDIRKDSQVGFGVKIKADEPPLERCFTQMSIYDYSGLEIACRSNMQISTSNFKDWANIDNSITKIGRQEIPVSSWMK